MKSEINVDDSDIQKFTSIFGKLFFLVLGILSVLFYKERMLYYDPSFFIFNIVNENSFSIALNRWGAVIAQIFPLAAIKIGLSLNQTLIIYSLSFIVIYYGCFLFCQYIMRDYIMSSVLILSLCLTFRIAFYYPTAELYMGLALSIVFWSLLRRINLLSYYNKLFAIGFLSLFIVTLSYFHQIILIILFGVIVIQWITEKKIFNIPLTILAAFTLFWLFIRVNYLTESEYENNKLISLSQFINELPNITNNLTFIYFQEYCTRQISLAIILFVIFSTFLFLKNKLLAFFIFIYTLAFGLLVIVTLYRGESIVMMENYFAVFGFFFSIPIVFGIARLNKYSFLLIMLLLTSYSVVKIYNSSSPLTKRVKKLENMIQYGRQLEPKKYIILNENFKYTPFGPSWATPFESLIQSTLTNPSDAISFFMRYDTTKLDINKLNSDDIFLGPEWSPYWFTTPGLNQHYFRVPRGNYLDLSTNQDKLNLSDSVFSNSSFFLTPYEQSLNYGDFAEITIINKSNTILYSVPGKVNQVLIGYHLLDTLGKVIKWDNIRSRIELDIHPGKSYTQELNIDYPGSPGTYLIQADIVTEGVKWWNINSTFKLIVK
jgi:hypothetical protein